MASQREAIHPCLASLPDFLTERAANRSLRIRAHQTPQKDRRISWGARDRHGVDLPPRERVDQVDQRLRVRRERPSVRWDLDNVSAARLHRIFELDIGEAITLDDDARTRDRDGLHGFQHFVRRERIAGR